MSRLTMDIAEQQRQVLKAMSEMEGKAIKQYALEKLFPYGAVSDKAWQELKSLLEARIDEALAGKVSAMSIQQILDDELRSVQ